MFLLYKKSLSGLRNIHVHIHRVCVSDTLYNNKKNYNMCYML